MTGSELKQWRERMGYRHQTDAAVALGVPYRTYQRWERSKAVGRVVELATQALAMQAAWPKALESVRTFNALMRDH